MLQCVITWIIVVYARVTERVPSCRGAYNIWAILALDLFAVILWLSAMAAVAAKRAAFVTIRSSFFRRYYIVFLNKTGLDVLSAIAGLSAAELCVPLFCLPSISFVLCMNLMEREADMTSSAQRDVRRHVCVHGDRLPQGAQGDDGAELRARRRARGRGRAQVGRGRTPSVSGAARPCVSTAASTGVYPLDSYPSQCKSRDLLFGQ